MALTKQDVRDRYIVRKTIEQPKPSRNLQPEIGRIKAMITALDKLDSTSSEWARLGAEVDRLSRVVWNNYYAKMRTSPNGMPE